jgi:hypothetical protein
MNVLQPRGVDLFGAASASGIGAWHSGKSGSLLVAIICMLLCWCVAYALDRKNLHIRI